MCVSREQPNSRYVCVCVNLGGAARGCLEVLGYRPIRGTGGLSMPRVLLGDKVYPWIAVAGLGITTLDIGLVWYLF